MSNIKITDYPNEESTFTFPYNPRTIDLVTSKFIDQRNLPYYFTFLGFTSPIKSTISIVLNGHFSGDTKNSNYRSLVKKTNVPQMMKLFFENNNDKFYLCTGTNIQKVPTGDKPLHIDYVASFFSPFGMLFDAIQKSGLKTSSEENEGDMTTPIEEITGTVTSGVAVTIKDKNDNGFTFTPNTSGTMSYKLIDIVSSDNTIYLAEYFYVTISNIVQVVKNASTSGDIMLTLEEGESLNDIFSTGTVTGITPTFKFRDGWTSD
jgi:hypothetical protein